jgi:cation transport regulator ChaC
VRDAAGGVMDKVGDAGEKYEYLLSSLTKLQNFRNKNKYWSKLSEKEKAMPKKCP